jgi:(p)ppGpp synthase/HD superfamily hydrolase
MNGFQKRKLALRSWLQGRRYFKALEAMELAESMHKGVRKDGITPEFDHPVSVAIYVRTLPDLLYPEETLVAALSHDLGEDYNVSQDYVTQRWGSLVGNAFEALTKVRNGIKKNPEQVKLDIGGCPIASIVKPSDRGHNQGAMVGVFTIPKQKSYIVETKEEILPVLKIAKRRFPQQEAAYENMKHLLMTQIALIEAVHAAVKA